MKPTIILFAIILTLFLAFHWFDRWMTRRLNRLWDRTSPEAKIRAPCYVRESCMEEPGVAQVMDGTLTIFTVTGKEFQVPIDQVRLSRVRKNKMWGRYPWWGKTCFELNTPQTSGLILGFSAPAPWIDLFNVS